ncbi:hypothetical protein HDU79_005972 [Rhizoclosmatium sp. JEL0117]|nr:hypothetical protein HDU79_005972 [Rhizoclosmatium sp. JEL0117]
MTSPPRYSQAPPKLPSLENPKQIESSITDAGNQVARSFDLESSGAAAEKAKASAADSVPSGEETKNKASDMMKSTDQVAPAAESAADATKKNVESQTDEAVDLGQQQKEKLEGEPNKPFNVEGMNPVKLSHTDILRKDDSSFSHDEKKKEGGEQNKPFTGNTEGMNPANILGKNDSSSTEGDKKESNFDPKDPLHLFGKNDPSSSSTPDEPKDQSKSKPTSPNPSPFSLENIKKKLHIGGKSDESKPVSPPTGNDNDDQGRDSSPKQAPFSLKNVFKLGGNGSKPSTDSSTDCHSQPGPNTIEDDVPEHSPIEKFVMKEETKVSNAFSNIKKHFQKHEKQPSGETETKDQNDNAGLLGDAKNTYENASDVPAEPASPKKEPFFKRALNMSNPFTSQQKTPSTPVEQSVPHNTPVAPESDLGLEEKSKKAFDASGLAGSRVPDVHDKEGGNEEKENVMSA